MIWYGSVSIYSRINTPDNKDENNATATAGQVDRNLLDAMLRAYRMPWCPKARPVSLLSRMQLRGTREPAFGAMFGASSKVAGFQCCVSGLWLGRLCL